MTEHKIFKYIIPPQDNCELVLPVGSKILSVAEQRDNIVIYVLVPVSDEELSTKKVKILVTGTGHTIHESMYEYKFLGTVNMYNGTLMFHVFYKE